MIPTREFIVRLGDADRESVRAHFIALGPDDRRLRFAGPVADEAIAAYVDRIDFAADAVFAVHDDDLRPVALIHVGAQRRGGGARIVALPGGAGTDWATPSWVVPSSGCATAGWHEVFVRCLAENAGMMHLARKNGMRLGAIPAPNTDGRLELDAATADSFVAEWLEDQRGEAKRESRANAAVTRAPMIAGSRL
jgi:hypothetical protein